VVVWCLEGDGGDGKVASLGKCLPERGSDRAGFDVRSIPSGRKPTRLSYRDVLMVNVYTISE
jgi:hypothetical protein